jgi:hypothetical protein
VCTTQGIELGASTHDRSTLSTNQRPPCFCGPTASGSPHFGLCMHRGRPKLWIRRALKAGMPRRVLEEEFPNLEASAVRRDG